MTRTVITDELWARLAPLLPRNEGKQGRPPKNNRNFIEAVLWIQRTGAPWRDLPKMFGPWKTHYNRFNNWSKKGHFDSVFEVLKKRWRFRRDDG